MKHLDPKFWDKSNTDLLNKKNQNALAVSKLKELRREQEAKLTALETLRKAQRASVNLAMQGDNVAKLEAEKMAKQATKLNKEWKQEEDRMNYEETKLMTEAKAMKAEEAEWSKYKEELQEMTQWETMARNDELLLKEYETTSKEEITGVWAVLGFIGFGFAICFYCCCMTNYFKEYLFEKMREYEKLKARGGEASFEMPTMEKDFRTSPRGGGGGGSGEFNDVDLGDLEDALNG
jgi:hypothetical protein